MAYENFYATRTTEPINATDSVIQVDKAPSVTEGWLVIESRSLVNREIVRFTGVDVTMDGNFLTGVARGQQDTIAVPHEGFASVEMNVTKADLDEALNVNSNIPQTIKDVFGDNTSETTFATQDGLDWTQDSGRLGSMTAGVVYIAGNRTLVPAVTSHTFPATKDTYVDATPSGTITYDSVNVGDPAPTKVANTVRIARITTDATDITEIKNIREMPYDNWNLSSGSLSIITKEVPTGSVNGTNTQYFTVRAYVGGSLQVYVNGLAQSGFVTETNPATGEFNLDEAPVTGDDIVVAYQYATAVTINADTVDGYHANATPTANMIPVLDSNAKMPINTSNTLVGTYPMSSASLTTNGTTVTLATLSGITETGKYKITANPRMSSGNSTSVTDTVLNVFINGVSYTGDYDYYTHPAVSWSKSQLMVAVIPYTAGSGDVTVGIRRNNGTATITVVAGGQVIVERVG